MVSGQDGGEGLARPERLLPVSLPRRTWVGEDPVLAVPWRVLGFYAPPWAHPPPPPSPPPWSQLEACTHAHS